MATYGFDDAKNKKEVYTKDEVITILQQAIESGSTEDIDPSLAPTPAKVKEIHNNDNVAFWVGTESEFEALGANVGLFIGRIDQNKNVYILTDDSALESINEELQQAAQRDSEWQNNTPRLITDNEHSTPTNIYSDYEGVKRGDLLINSTGLYYCRLLNISQDFIEWQRIYINENMLPKLYTEESGTPDTDPAAYPGVKYGDFVLTTVNNILYYCNSLTAQYCGWAKIIRPVDLLSKQDLLTAGKNINITNNVISATLPQYELIASITATPENPIGISSFVNLLQYKIDRFIIECIGMKGKVGKGFVFTNTLPQGYGSFSFTYSTFFSENVAKTLYIIIDRKTPNMFEITTGGVINQTTIQRIINNSNDITYEEKLAGVYFSIQDQSIETDARITEGTINLYGIKGV